MDISEKELARFWKYVDRGGPDECWLWLASTQKRGYGQLSVGGKNRIATHVSLAVVGRFRPGSLICLHSCDNPRCVNPRHLRWGTHQDNTDDKMRRGRDRKARGSATGSAKLSEQQVEEIRKSDEAARVLAKRYDVCVSTINHARVGKTWSHLGAKPYLRGKLKGTQHPNCKITEEVAREIKFSSTPTKELMAKFGISQSSVSHIRVGRLWAHLT